MDPTTYVGQAGLHQLRNSVTVTRQISGKCIRIRICATSPGRGNGMAVVPLASFTLQVILTFVTHTIRGNMAEYKQGIPITYRTVVPTQDPVTRKQIFFFWIPRVDVDKQISFRCCDIL